jgi:hypothetical protein
VKENGLPPSRQNRPIPVATSASTTTSHESQTSALDIFIETRFLDFDELSAKQQSVLPSGQDALQHVAISGTSATHTSLLDSFDGRDKNLDPDHP